MMISVLMPSLNYGRFIGQAVESVLDCAAEVELIVQDACSADNTQAVLQHYEDARLKVTVEPDGGQSDALNRALSKASGDFVGWLNADEYYLPGGIEKAAVLLGDYDVTYGDSIHVNAHGDLLKRAKQHRFSSYVLRNYGCYPQTVATFFRRDVLLDVGGWNVNYRRVMDWELLLRLDRHGARIGYLPETLGAFRIHPDQVTAAPSAGAAREYAELEAQYGVRRSGVPRVAALALHGALKHAARR